MNWNRYSYLIQDLKWSTTPLPNSISPSLQQLPIFFHHHKDHTSIFISNIPNIVGHYNYERPQKQSSPYKYCYKFIQHWWQTIQNGWKFVQHDGNLSKWMNLPTTTQHRQYLECSVYWSSLVPSADYPMQFKDWTKKVSVIENIHANSYLSLPEISFNQLSPKKEPKTRFFSPHHKMQRGTHCMTYHYKLIHEIFQKVTTVGEGVSTFKLQIHSQEKSWAELCTKFVCKGTLTRTTQAAKMHATLKFLENWPCYGTILS